MTKEPTSVDDETSSDQPQPAADARADETLGAFLKRHRELQGKDLEDVAKSTRIHASTLRAIEEDNPKALPAEVFARGFVKNYAQYLGLNPNEALARYIEQSHWEGRATEKGTVQDVLAGEPLAEGRTFPMGRFITFIVVVGVLFLAGYLILSFLNPSVPSEDSPRQEGTPQARDAQRPALSSPATGEPGSESGAGNEQPEQAPPPMQPGVTESALPLPEKDGHMADPLKGGGVQAQTLQGPVTPAPASQASVAPSTSAVVKSPGMNYVLEAKFTGATWVSVQIDKGKKKSAIYQPGDHMVWQAEKKISLFVGNAGGIVLTLNGKPVPAIGKSMESARVSFPAQ